MFNLFFVEPVSGIPCFWLTVFRNVPLLSSMIQDHDEPLFKHLEDIKVVFSAEPMVRLCK